MLNEYWLCYCIVTTTIIYYDVLELSFGSLKIDIYTENSNNVSDSGKLVWKMSKMMTQIFINISTPSVNKEKLKVM